MSKKKIPEFCCKCYPERCKKEHVFELNIAPDGFKQVVCLKHFIERELWFADAIRHHTGDYGQARYKILKDIKEKIDEGLII